MTEPDHAMTKHGSSMLQGKCSPVAAGISRHKASSGGPNEETGKINQQSSAGSACGRMSTRDEFDANDSHGLGLVRITSPLAEHNRKACPGGVGKPGNDVGTCFTASEQKYGGCFREDVGSSVVYSKLDEEHAGVAVSIIEYEPTLKSLGLTCHPSDRGSTWNPRRGFNTFHSKTRSEAPLLPQVHSKKKTFDDDRVALRDPAEIGSMVDVDNEDRVLCGGMQSRGQYTDLVSVGNQESVLGNPSRGCVLGVPASKICQEVPLRAMAQDVVTCHLDENTCSARDGMAPLRGFLAVVWGAKNIASQRFKISAVKTQAIPKLVAQRFFRWFKALSRGKISTIECSNGIPPGISNSYGLATEVVASIHPSAGCSMYSVVVQNEVNIIYRRE